MTKCFKISNVHHIMLVHQSNADTHKSVQTCRNYNINHNFYCADQKPAIYFADIIKLIV